jgi:5-(carboxyamino)imidazole ribonucleotide synthase
MRHSLPSFTLGILGGGQLGRMLIYRTKKLGLRFSVLDGDPEAPAAAMADTFILGGLKDPEALERLVGSCDIATYEIEHIDTEVLCRLEAGGARILPSPETLKIIQDKLAQKDLFLRKSIPVPPFASAEDPDHFDFSGFDFPVVQKVRREGYDGRGVLILNSPGDPRLKGPSLIEKLVDIEKELAVMVARTETGSLAVYPVVEMIFNPDHNICDSVLAPARISDALADRVREIAVLAVLALQGVGVFGVELFLSRSGEVLLNEVAPRPHNSGHYTMEACETCQFEQHLRAVAGFPLGSTRLLSPAVMLNLLGEPGARGSPRIEGLFESLGIPGVSLHLYGKKEVRPYRKMGHVTVLGETVEEAIHKAESVRRMLKIRGNGEDR